MGLGDIERLGGAAFAEQFEEMGRGRSTSQCQAMLRRCHGGKLTRGKTGRAWLGEAVAVVTAVLQQWCGGRYAIWLWQGIELERLGGLRDAVDKAWPHALW